MSHKKAIRIDPLAEKLPPGGFDTHAHLDDESFTGCVDEIIARAAAVGVSRICNVFLGPDEYRSGKNLFATHKNIIFILGIHPHDGQKCTTQAAQDMENLFHNDARLRAVGEIGLDFFHDHCPRELQYEAFGLQINLAKKINKPIVIHCRDAEQECLTFLEAAGLKDFPVLFHCFNGNKAMATRIIRNGWYVSIAGPVTYPANKDLREAVRILPKDRMLLETDCPYLPPVPWRGTRNEPAYTVFTARACAQARDEDPAELWKRCGENASRFFGLENLDE